MNAHQMWITFRNIIDNFQNECVPLKKMRNAQMKKPLWWKASINKALNTKKRLFKKLKTTGNAADLTNYKLARANATREVKKSKRLSEIELAKSSNKDPKKFFSYYKFNSKNQEKIGPISNNGELVHSEPEVVDVLTNTLVLFLLKKTPLTLILVPNLAIQIVKMNQLL